MSSLFPLPSPLLPPFDSILIKGNFHPSAPIHLCLTHVSNHPGTKAVVLTPSRQKWLAALCDFNDDWLNECGGFGAVSQILSEVDVFYPPTPAHLCLILSMLRTSEPNDDFPPWGKTTLDRPPSLLVMHEISAYFLDDTSSTRHTASSYVSMIAHALSATYSLSTESTDASTSIALMDSSLDLLQLPILQNPGPIFPGPDGEEQSEDSSRLKEPIVLLVEQYFQWVGTVETHADSILSGSAPHLSQMQPNRKLSLHCNIPFQDCAESTWEWYEKQGGLRGFSDRSGIVFAWP